MKVADGTVRDYFGETAEAELATAAAKGDVGEVSRLVSVGANVNAAGDKNMTPLMWAFSAQNVEGMRALLEAGADPNQRFGPEKNIHPVWMAATMDKPDRLKVLLEFKGDPNATGGGAYFNALMQAVKYPENIKLLVQAGADVNATDGIGDTVALAAANLAQFDTLIYLLEHGYRYNLPLIAWEVNDLPLSSEIEPKRQQVLAILKTLGVTPPSGKAPPMLEGK
ncbi:ankyrin repeat protein [Herbaspirillum sp. SJZ099]|nr:ankyrin repeat protein [Herbaspirillum sp. SJZ099]